MHDVFISYVQGQKIAETMKAALVCCIVDI